MDLILMVMGGLAILFAIGGYNAFAGIGRDARNRSILRLTLSKAMESKRLDHNDDKQLDEYLLTFNEGQWERLWDALIDNGYVIKHDKKLVRQGFKANGLTEEEADRHVFLYEKMGHKRYMKEYGNLKDQVEGKGYTV